MDRKPRGNSPARQARDGAPDDVPENVQESAPESVQENVHESAEEGTRRRGHDPRYWASQDAALGKARKAHAGWMQARREAPAPGAGRPDGKNSIGQARGSVAWKRETFQLPRAQAQARAREFLRKYPKAAYWSEVESWRELPDGQIEFTMRRLPSAD